VVMATILRSLREIIAYTARAWATQLVHFGPAVAGISGFIVPYPTFEQFGQTADGERGSAPTATPANPSTHECPPQIVESRSGPQLSAPDRSDPVAPPPGHPEQLVPHVPLSPLERSLLSELA
jgi:hypothetical protein